MNLSAALNVAVVATVVACLACPTVIRAQNMNRYGKQQLTQKQYRYGNPTWANGVNRAAGWAQPSYGNIMRHYPLSMARYGAMTGAGGRQSLPSDDYYDDEARGSVVYDPRRFDRLDYAVVRYPTYGAPAGYGGYSGYGGYGGYGYYPGGGIMVDDDLLYDVRDDDDDDDDRDRDDLPFGDRGAQIGGYEPAAAARYPAADKVHDYRKVFMSNLVSPSNAFKSPKERQLYDFWESLINGDLDDMRQTDGDDDRQQSPLGLGSTASLLYQHLPPIFLKLQQQQQKQKLQQKLNHLQQPRYKSAEALQTPPPPPPPPPARPPLPPAAYSSSPLQQQQQQTVQRGNFYKQWANGSPLIKRSPAQDNDDVRQLRELQQKPRAATAAATTMATSTTTTTTAAVSGASTTTAVAPSSSMADGGQREFVLPRPAGEKSGLESLLESIAARGGLRGDYGENGDFRQEAKVNKKRSFVSDETSLAAQLGALRKN